MKYLIQISMLTSGNGLKILNSNLLLQSIYSKRIKKLLIRCKIINNKKVSVKEENKKVLYIT